MPTPPATIYLLRDPRTGAVRYVGKTTVRIKVRFWEHLKTAKRRKTHRDKWIAALRSLGLQPVMEVLEIAGEDWPVREQFWIEHFRGLGERLTNHTLGGEGVPGYWTLEARERQAACTKQQWSSERKARQSKLARAQLRREFAADPDKLRARGEKLKTPESRQKVREFMRTFGASAEGKRILLAKFGRNNAGDSKFWTARRRAAQAAHSQLHWTAERKRQASERTRAQMLRIWAERKQAKTHENDPTRTLPRHPAGIAAERS